MAQTEVSIRLINSWKKNGATNSRFKNEYCALTLVDTETILSAEKLKWLENFCSLEQTRTNEQLCFQLLFRNLLNSQKWIPFENLFLWLNCPMVVEDNWIFVPLIKCLTLNEINHLFQLLLSNKQIQKSVGLHTVFWKLLVEERGVTIEQIIDIANFILFLAPRRYQSSAIDQQIFKFNHTNIEILHELHWCPSIQSWTQYSINYNAQQPIRNLKLTHELVDKQMTLPYAFDSPCCSNYLSVEHEDKKCFDPCTIKKKHEYWCLAYWKTFPIEAEGSKLVEWLTTGYCYPFRLDKLQPDLAELYLSIIHKSPTLLRYIWKKNIDSSWVILSNLMSPAYFHCAISMFMMPLFGCHSKPFCDCISSSIMGDALRKGSGEHSAILNQFSIEKQNNVEKTESKRKKKRGTPAMLGPSFHCKCLDAKNLNDRWLTKLLNTWECHEVLPQILKENYSSKYALIKMGRTIAISHFLIFLYSRRITATTATQMMDIVLGGSWNYKNLQIKRFRQIYSLCGKLSLPTGSDEPIVSNWLKEKHLELINGSHEVVHQCLVAIYEQIY